MKRNLATIAVIIAAILPDQTAFGQQCPAGKVPITIVNPGGKVIEVCVASAAIPYIGGPSDKVIAAVCPCFSQEQIAAAFANDSTMEAEIASGATITGESCTFGQVLSSTGRYVYGSKGPDDKTVGRCSYGSSDVASWSPKYNNSCQTSTSVTMGPITAEEADACVAIIQTFVVPQ